ncbi:hypothetical protein GEMRC1_000439 [Eukaryota sp. GEM-RC1]
MKLLSVEALSDILTADLDELSILYCTPLSSSSPPPTALIPGTVVVDTNVLEHSPDWNLICPSCLLDILAFNDISLNTMIVVYSDLDLMPACRLLFSLHSLGFSSLHLLNGSLKMWTLAGNYLSNRFSFLRVPPFNTCSTLSFPHTCTFDDVCSFLMRNDTIIVDVRSSDEHHALSSGYCYIEEKGKIPLSVWGNSGTNAHKIESLVVNDSLVDFDLLKKIWLEVGLSPEKTIVFYCGTGWRASVAFVCAVMMGFEKVFLYDGGWLDWSSHMKQFSNI